MYSPWRSITSTPESSIKLELIDIIHVYAITIVTWTRVTPTYRASISYAASYAYHSHAYEAYALPFGHANQPTSTITYFTRNFLGIIEKSAQQWITYSSKEAAKSRAPDRNRAHNKPWKSSLNSQWL